MKHTWYWFFHKTVVLSHIQVQQYSLTINPWCQLHVFQHVWIHPISLHSGPDGVVQFVHWLKCFGETYWFLGANKGGRRTPGSPGGGLLTFLWAPGCDMTRCFPDHEPEEADGLSVSCCKGTSRCTSVAPKQQISWLHGIPGSTGSRLSSRCNSWKWVWKFFL